MTQLRHYPERQELLPERTHSRMVCPDCDWHSEWARMPYTDPVGWAAAIRHHIKMAQNMADAEHPP